MRYAAIGLAAILAVTLAWRGMRWTVSPYRTSDAEVLSSYSQLSTNASADGRVVSWQRDFSDALNGAMQDLADGRPSEAEIAVDRAETILTTERLISGDAKAEFFEPALSALDRVVAGHSDDSRLVEHVDLARISLAELRSSLVPVPMEAADGKRVSIAVPREIMAGDTLDPSSFNGRILDASVMPDTAEILLPPTSRALNENIRVENLVLQGAAQTLDGIHWHNVIFVGTRLRYEGGDIDLQNIQFVRCRFGFSTDERGARLAAAVARGQSSISIP